MKADAYTKVVLTVIAVSLAAIAFKGLPLDRLSNVIRPLDVEAQASCPAVSKDKLAKGLKLVGAWTPMNVPRPDPRLIFESDDAYVFVAPENFYRNASTGDPARCVYWRIERG